MTQSEFESLKLRAPGSGMTFKAFLASEGIAYSTVQPSAIACLDQKKDSRPDYRAAIL